MYEVGEEELAALKKVLLSKKYFRFQGPGKKGQCDLFEEEFSQKLMNPYSLLVTSGTNALKASLMAAGIGPGDEVIIPCYTFFATAVAVLNAGAIPVIVNIDDELGIDVKDIEKKITPQTKGIIPVHMDGLNCSLQEIIHLAQKYKLKVIEDSCQALGGKYQGKYLGTWGDFGAFSLNVDKILSAGEGGIVTCHSRTHYEKLLYLHDACCPFGPTKKDEFQEVMPMIGQSMRVSELTGALMREQLKKLDHILHHLRIRKEIYVEDLQDIPLKIIRGHDPAGECCTHLHLEFPSVELAMKVGEKLRAQKIFAVPLTTKPAHASWKWSHYLMEKRFCHQGYDIFTKFQVDTKKLYRKTNWLFSMEKMSRILKWDIPYDLSVEETAKLSSKIKKMIKNEC